MPWTLGGEDDAIPHRVRNPGLEVAIERQTQPPIASNSGGGIAGECNPVVKILRELVDYAP
jgi:hypothetical protein